MSRASELSKKIAEFRKQHTINYIGWENKLLLLFHQLEGMPTLKQIYDLIENHQDTFQLKPEHFKSQYGVPAYKNQVRSHIANLVQSGHLKWVDNGQYRITEKGIKCVNEFRKLSPELDKKK
ncbi:hypothetical protein HYX05_04230 [Candidatus Woesearchaeota archaeon]|nr:hypothetical protein [Candidatus Woesearchaeota archaeon]